MSMFSPLQVQSTTTQLSILIKYNCAVLSLSLWVHAYLFRYFEHQIAILKVTELTALKKEEEEGEGWLNT